MADPSATFVLELEDETSGAAESAAKSLEKLKGAIDDDLKELRAMQQAMKNLKAASSPNLEQIKALQLGIDAKRESIAKSQSKWISLGGSFAGAGSAARKGKAGLDDLLQTATKMPGPLGALASKLGSIGALVGAGGPVTVGIFLIVAAMTALIAVTAGATAALLRYGVAQADARRSELLRLEGLTTIRRWHGLAAGSATELQQSIDRVSASVASGRGEVAGYAEQLYRMGLRGQDLQDALEGVAITTQVQGERMGRRFAGMAAAAVRTGRSVRALADDVRSRLGGIAARQMLSLDVQARKLQESFQALFSGLRIEGLLRGLSQITELFSQNTASGRALKQLAEVVLQPLIDALVATAPLARRFVQGMIIGFQELTILVLRFAVWLRRAFAGTEIARFTAGIDGMQIALYAGMALVGTAVALFVILAVVVAAVAASFAFLLIPLAAIAAGFAALIANGIDLYRWFTTTDFAAIGRSIVDGIIGGIRSRVASLTSELQGLAATARGALERALQIRSPSRVFAAVGLQIPRGLAQGVERGAPEARGSIEEMLGPVTVGEPATPSSSSSSTSSSSRTSVVIEELHVHADGDDPEDFARRLREELVRLLSGELIGQGAAPESA